MTRRPSIPRAFHQSDAGGWSDDIPERQDDDAPDLERDEDPPPDEVP